MGLSRVEYGLTEKGFIPKPLSVILEEERTAFRAAFGNEIDISDVSIAGAYIGNQAVKITQLWEILDGLWSIGDLDQAAGIYLDRLAALVNVRRNAAVSTAVTACLWGAEGTAVLSGAIAKLRSTGGLFILRDTVSIGRDSLLGAWIKVSTVESGAVYAFAVNGVSIEYAAVETDDEETIQSALAQALGNALTDLFIAENLGGDGLKIHSADGVTPFAFALNDAKLEIAALGAVGVYAARDAGPVYAPAGALTEIVSNVDGLVAIYNYADGVTGRVAESDTELRVNIKERQKLASSNEVAIQNEIWRVKGVRYVRVYSNRAMVEIDGRPPKCYEAVVVGGDDKEIAETIFEKGPAGIEAFGNTVVAVKDSEGFEHTVGFSRPENVYIWLKISYARNAEEDFPANGEAAVKEKIEEWGALNQGVGVDFIFQKLLKPIYETPGLGFADIKAAATASLASPPDDAYAGANIIINDRRIALIDRTRISLTEIEA
jgi:uncharacterized phage protein gp47/JayE